jgi:hypothetical protein
MDVAKDDIALCLVLRDSYRAKRAFLETNWKVGAHAR